MPRYHPEHAQRPGTVTAIRGIVFQSDGRSTIGRMFIRPVEALDRWTAGVLPKANAPSLAMHAGIHLEVDGHANFVVEQLVGTWDLTFRNGLNWTPYEKFKQRDRGGWDVTVPAIDFRQIDTAAVEQAVGHLNSIIGRAFVGEDCTAFIERAFNGCRLFADSPLLRLLGFGARVGDPALPLLRADARLPERTARLLQFDAIKRLPDPLAGGYSSSSRRSTPISRTARRFFK